MSPAMTGAMAVPAAVLAGVVAVYIDPQLAVEGASGFLEAEIVIQPLVSEVAALEGQVVFPSLYAVGK